MATKKRKVPGNEGICESGLQPGVVQISWRIKNEGLSSLSPGMSNSLNGNVGPALRPDAGVYAFEPGRIQ